MNLVMRAFPVLLGLSLCTALASAADPVKPNEVPGRKVDQPLPETYEPLMGSPRNDEDFSQELKELRRLKEQQREEAERRQQAPVAGQKAPPPANYPIQEPAPASGARTQAPAVEAQGDDLRIRDTGQ